MEEGVDKRGNAIWSIFKTLLWVEIVLNALTYLIGLSDIRIYYGMGRVGYALTFVFFNILWLLLTYALIGREEWARDWYIAMTVVLMLFVPYVWFNFANGNTLFGFLWGVMLIISISCTLILLTKRTWTIFSREATHSDALRSPGILKLCIMLCFISWMLCFWSPSIIDSRNTESCELDAIAAAATGSENARQKLVDYIEDAKIKEYKHHGRCDSVDRILVGFGANCIADDYIKTYKGLDDKNIKINDLHLPKPPLLVSARNGVLSDQVIQVHNDSDTTQCIAVVIYDNNNCGKAVGIAIKPKETKELGRFEFANGWKPKVGDNGLIQVHGYKSFLTFALLSSGKCANEWSYFVPSDCPNRIKKELIGEDRLALMILRRTGTSLER